MWEINNSLQLLNFLRSLAFGVILSLIYDFLRAFRKTHSYPVLTVFFQDIVYSLVIAFLSFVFLLGVTNGEPRGFVLVGAALGFLLCRYTLSRIVLKLLFFFISRSEKIFRFLTRKFYEFFERSEKNLKKLRKKFKKSKKTLEND